MQIGLKFLSPLKARSAGAGLFLAVMLCSAPAGGQGKPPSPLPPAPAGRTILALHWIGKTRFAQDTNAAYQMEIWKRPESAALGAQTLDKLARALPALVGAAGAAATQDFSGVLRGLLADLVEAESFCEVRAHANQPNEYALAIRLSAARTAFWRTNVATVAEAFTGGKKGGADPGDSGWRVSSGPPARTVQLALAGDWTVLGIGGGEGKLFADFVRRFRGNQPPATGTNNYWIEADADLGALFRLSPSVTTQSLPAVHLTVEGAGQIVRTRGVLTFPQPFPAELGPWNIPTNWIHDPLVSFTAVRGVQTALESLKLWQTQVGGAAPDQFCFWTLEGLAFRTYFAARWPESSNRFYNVSQRAMESLNRNVTNDLCLAVPMTNANAILWTCNPFLQAFLRHDAEPGGEIASGGFFPPSRGTRPMPAELLSQFIPKTNLLYYDWEITESRVFGWLQVASFLQMVSGKAQLSSESAGVRWLVGVATNLGNAATTLQLTDPTHVALSRSSSIGFTGLELQLLMDWLESPTFPRGLHTQDAPVQSPRKKRPVNAPGTNSPPAGGAVPANRPP